MKNLIKAIITLLILLWSVVVDGHTHEGDFVLEIDDCNCISIEHRAAGAELEASSGFSVSEPGFDCEPGTFPAGTSNGFNILEPLKRWDDINEVFAALDADTAETVIVSFTPFWAQSDNGFVAGFEIPVSSDGSWHKHFNYTLISDGESDPREGIYMLEMELYNTSAGIGGTEALWIVFNNGLDEQEHESVVEWVNEHFAELRDITTNGTVNFEEYSLVAAENGRAGCNCADFWCGGTDINRNGSVNLDDIMELAEDWLDRIE